MKFPQYLTSEKLETTFLERVDVKFKNNKKGNSRFQRIVMPIRSFFDKKRRTGNDKNQIQTHFYFRPFFRSNPPSHSKPVWPMSWTLLLWIAHQINPRKRTGFSLSLSTSFSPSGLLKIKRSDGCFTPLAVLAWRSNHRREFSRYRTISQRKYCIDMSLTAPFIDRHASTVGPTFQLVISPLPPSSRSIHSFGFEIEILEPRFEFKLFWEKVKARSLRFSLRLVPLSYALTFLFLR